MSADPDPGPDRAPVELGGIFAVPTPAEPAVQLVKNRRPALVSTSPVEIEPVEDIDDVIDDGAAGELVPFDEPEPWAVSPFRGPLERFANRPLPTLASTAASGRWWLAHLSKAGVQLLMHSPQLILYQVPPIARGLARGATAYATWRACSDLMAAAKVAEEKDRHKRMDSVEKRKRSRLQLALLGLCMFLGSIVVGLLLGYGLLVAAVLTVLLAILDLVGRKDAPVTHRIEVMPRSHFQEGAPSAMVVADIRAVLVEYGHDGDRLAVTDPRTGEYGIAVKVHSPREFGEGEVTAIERGLQTYRGAVSIVGEPNNAAISEIRVMWRDPLKTVMVPAYAEPNSRTIATAAELGYGIGRVPLLLNFMRTNMIIVGGPGSGKSSAMWAMIDWLSTCRDVVLHGIDLSGGPAFRVWGNVFETRAFSRDEARDLLHERIACAHERTRLLAERSEPVPGRPPPGAEHWTPEDAAAGDGMFHITFVDELPLLAADPELCELYGEHQRIGRKAGDTSVGATQDLSGDTLHATSLRKYPSTLIMLACSREDVTSGLGGGKVKEGWAPHRFTPAEGDNANDAGKAFVKSGQHNKPNPWRFARLDDLGEIHRRAIERIEAGRPTDGAPPPVFATTIPEPLAGLAAAFRAQGTPEFLATATILEILAQHGQETTDRKLAAALKKGHAFGPDRQRVDGEPTRGYWWRDVEAALEAL